MVTKEKTFLFIKPEDIDKIEYVKQYLDENDQTILSKGYFHLTSSQVDSLYIDLYSFANNYDITQATEYIQKQFSKKCGYEWNKVPILTAYQALELYQFSINGSLLLEEKWYKYIYKLSENFYISNVDGFWVINGFYPAMKKKLTWKPLYYFVIEGSNQCLICKKLKKLVSIHWSFPGNMDYELKVTCISTRL